MRPPLDRLDYYALLGVAQDAGLAQIKAGFRDLARRYHPDRFAGDAQQVAEATQVYLRATEAYRVLCDPRQRALYDAQLRSGKLRLDARATEGSGAPRSSRRPDGVMHPRARPFMARAEQALAAGDLPQAKLNIHVALRHDPDNEVLQKRLADIDRRLAEAGSSRRP